MIMLAAAGLMLFGAAGAVLAQDEHTDVPRLVSFGGACRNCGLAGRRLIGAKFIGADFAGASLAGADLRGANFIGSTFTGADLTKADVRGASMMAGNFLLANFSGAKLAGLEAHATVFTDANFNHVAATCINLTASNLSRVDGRDADFHRGIFTRATLVSGRFQGASFQNAKLDGADLADGDFTGADFRDADLAGASLDGATLAGADLQSARNLTQQQLDGACADAKTRLPSGLSGHACGGHGRRRVLEALGDYASTSLPPSQGGSTGEAGDGGSPRQRFGPPFVPSGHFPPIRGREGD
jgi:uncharacterized protein YjbI with pentapeptide repeats